LIPTFGLTLNDLAQHVQYIVLIWQILSGLRYVQAWLAKLDSSSMGSKGSFKPYSLLRSS